MLIDRQILDFQKRRSHDLASRKMVHSALVASIAGPIRRRTLTAVERTHARGFPSALAESGPPLMPFKQTTFGP
jgi:hypothetical protein